MGYRSEVVLAIAPEAAPAFMAMCAKYPKVNAFCFRDADYKASGHETEGDGFLSGIPSNCMLLMKKSQKLRVSCGRWKMAT